MKIVEVVIKFYKVIEVLLVLSMLFIITVYGVVYYMDKRVEKTIDIGQIWVFNDDVNDPFNNDNPRFRKVINMNGDYVEYVTIYHDTLSCKKSKFIIDSKRDKFYRGYYKIDLNN